MTSVLTKLDYNLIDNFGISKERMCQCTDKEE
jgi:hypothetical protein